MLGNMRGVSTERRELAYYIYPRASNDMWRWNLDQLQSRWSLFNGRKRVAIAVETKRRKGIRFERTVDPGDVMRAIGDPSVEYLIDENHKAGGESALFPRLVGPLLSPGNSVIFYAHAKGVTKLGHDAQWVARQWAGAMYETLLDYWPLVERSLQGPSVTSAGSFKIAGRLAHGSRWQYSGTFMWFKAASLAATPWHLSYSNSWAWVEDLPGIIWPWESGVDIFNGRGDANIYGVRDWVETINPALDSWREENLVDKMPVRL